MIVIKPTSNKHATDLEKDDDFFKQSHGLSLEEHTLCSIAPEEWDYTDFVTRKRITCPRCLAIINHCKGYKG